MVEALIHIQILSLNNLPQNYWPAFLSNGAVWIEKQVFFCPACIFHPNFLP
jgi:hypothetical protein